MRTNTGTGTLRGALLGIILAAACTHMSFAADFDISGDWINSGAAAYGQTAPGETVSFHEGKCNLITSADAYQLTGNAKSGYILTVSNFLSDPVPFSVKSEGADTIELTAEDGTVLSLSRNTGVSSGDVQTEADSEAPAGQEPQTENGTQPVPAVLFHILEPEADFQAAGEQNYVNSLPAPEMYSFGGKDKKAFYQVLNEKVQQYSLGFFYFVDPMGAIPDYSYLTGVLWTQFADLSGNGDNEFAILYGSPETHAAAEPLNILEIYDYRSSGAALIYSCALRTDFLPRHVFYEGHSCLFVQNANGDYKLLTMIDSQIHELHSLTTDGSIFLKDGNFVSEAVYLSTCNEWMILPGGTGKEIKVLSITEAGTGYDAQHLYVNTSIIKTLEELTGIRG